MEIFIRSYLESASTIMLFLITALTLFSLSKGADILVDEAVGLSVKWGVPKLIIGATIISLGTTLPEATVSVMAAINGNPDLALGNAVGSIIVDTGLIIGIASIIGKLPVDKSLINRQGKIQFFSGLLLVFFSIPFFSKNPGGNISQLVGVLFVALLVLYIYASIKWARKKNDSDISVEGDKTSSLMQVVKLIIGLFLIIMSSKILIPSVETIAIRISIPQSVIAATLVAFGTSLPELITAVTAVRKGHGEIAVGNIIGADILNVLFVVGSSAAVTKGGLDVPVNFYKLQFPAMIIILGAFRFFSKNADSHITKKEGVFLLAIYLVYLALNYI